MVIPDSPPPLASFQGGQNSWFLRQIKLDLFSASDIYLFIYLFFSGSAERTDQLKDEKIMLRLTNKRQQKRLGAPH